VGAFYGCSSLASVTIPNSVTEIGGGAFNGSGLISINIPNGVTSIGNGTFRDCSSLASVNIGNGVTSIKEYAFRGCSGLKLLTIGNNVKSIGYHAFYGCSGLESVTIPSSVTSIGDKAFYKCYLTSVICLCAAPPKKYVDSFSTTTHNYGTLYVPYGSKARYIRSWPQFLNIVEMDFTAIDEVQSDAPSVDNGNIYNLKGEIVSKNGTSHLPRGIYIRNGKKFLVP